MSELTPGIEAAAIVLLGTFEPERFYPAWFASEKLVFRTEELFAAKLEIVHPDAVVFSVESVKLTITRERFIVSSTHAPSYDLLRDLVLGAFSILASTPITAMGLNTEYHFAMPSETEWHAVGHRLAPKEPWAGLLEKPGMRSLSMQGVRTDDFKGYIVAKVEPSVRIKPGVFLQVNDHFDLGPKETVTNASAAMEALRTSWEASMARSKKIASAISTLR